MYYNKVEICGVNTAKLKTLSDDEKNALLLRVREGDEVARRELIDGNLRLVLSLVQRFTNRKENMDDLFQVGCIGLIKAVDHFNTDLGVKFSTYAVPTTIPKRNAPADRGSVSLLSSRALEPTWQGGRFSSNAVGGGVYFGWEEAVIDVDAVVCDDDTLDTASKHALLFL